MTVVPLAVAKQVVQVEIRQKNLIKSKNFNFCPTLTYFESFFSYLQYNQFQKIHFNFSCLKCGPLSPRLKFSTQTQGLIIGT